MLPTNIDYNNPADLSGGTNGTVASADQGESTLTQLGGLFSTLGTTVAQDFSAISGPTTVRPGTVIVNPNGTTSVAGSITSSSGFLFIGIAFVLLLFLLLRSR